MHAFCPCLESSSIIPLHSLKHEDLQRFKCFNLVHPLILWRLVGVLALILIVPFLTKLVDFLRRGYVESLGWDLDESLMRYLFKSLRLMDIRRYIVCQLEIFEAFTVWETCRAFNVNNDDLSLGRQIGLFLRHVLIHV